MKILRLGKIESPIEGLWFMRWPLYVLLLTCTCVYNLRGQNPKPTDLPSDEAQPQKTTMADSQPTSDYVIGPDDVVNIYVLDVPELSRDYRVSTTGTITIPIVANPLMASGLTLSQFTDSLSKELKTAGLVSDPHITTSVVQSRLHTVAITGAVKKPQIYSVFTQTTLLDMLSQAEGLADDASNTAIVHRGQIAMQALGAKEQRTVAPEHVEAEQTVKVDLKKLIESGDPNLNLHVYPGDRITIPRAGVVYVVGAVNKPGGFAMKPTAHGMTVLQALALAADTKTTALRDQSVIIRSDSQAPQGRKQIPIDLKKILRGKSEDPVLQAEDILFVPDSAGKHALQRGMESVIQAATGVAIYGARF